MTNININKNNALIDLQQLIEQNINTKLSYMPDSFKQQQVQALEFFKQRLFLEKIIDEAISFNKNLDFPNKNKNLHLTTTAEDLIDVFKLRSDVYTSINYQEEFPDIIEGLNFDKYDSNSAILFYKSNKIVTGTIRVVFDSHHKLPSEDKYSFDKIRNRHCILVELSRLIVRKENQSLNLEFKYLTSGVYHLFIKNKIDIILSSLKKEHYKLYSKFGGIEILEEPSIYGNLNQSSIILSWDPSEASEFFKKAFLS